jgi:FtsP/CotA-like multicopper oxidase with cupredoxin domain
MTDAPRQCIEDSGKAGKSVSHEGIVSTRREFLTGALAVSGAAISGLAVTGLPEPAQAQAGEVVFKKIGEIKSQNGRLRAVITVRNAKLSVPGDTSQTPPMLRYFEGKDAAGTVWPPAPDQGVLRSPLPGPTLRASVGELVEITYLNHIKTEEFPGGTIDRAETGVDGCDSAVNQSGINLYPQGFNDSGPNCFHASTTVNLHFHGTHVTPDGLGDNVLLQLRPNPAVTERAVGSYFEKIFEATANGNPPSRWEDLPEGWRETQLYLLRQYDDNAPWQGNRGRPGAPVLPAASQLLPEAEAMIRSGLWPQHQIGAYPFSFKLTEFVDAQGKPTGHKMGQCPGTHWYHAHKHGSTGINVFNGMAGVFVIEGDYDAALEKIYPDLRDIKKETQKVLIVQQFTDRPNAMRDPNPFVTPSLFVNGQANPTISMKPGEVQLWRFVNATVQSVAKILGFEKTGNAVPEFRQIAQDGVQFRWENFDKQDALPRARGYRTFAPGNRMDLLVKAPNLPTGTSSLSFPFRIERNVPSPGIESFVLLTLKVEGSPVQMAFPTEAQYPKFPPFLEDIDEKKIRMRRTVDFTGAQGDFGMDGRKFEGKRYDQTMVRDDCEEWTIRNMTSVVAHPFHIHVNPFQVIEIFDPVSKQLYKPEKNFVWQDTIAVPASDGTTPGYVKVRHPFVDFTGSYVMHCHILAHEDRGMMQLIRVIPRETIVGHH